MDKPLFRDRDPSLVAGVELALPRPQALILDMDGLLIDTERLYLEVNVLAAAELGYTLAPETNLGRVGVAIDGCRSLGSASGLRGLTSC
ncbi:MAG: hypothetical protein ACK5SX_11610, partial [Sandaracinobacter sp.]